MSADEGLAPLTVFSDLAAVYQHTHNDEDSQGHDGDHHQGGDSLFLLAGGHHCQEVCMLTACTDVPRMADTCWLVLLHQKPAGSMEAELTVGIWAFIKMEHHSGGHRRVGTQGRRGVLQGLAHSQQKTQSERGELSSRGDHFTGGGQQELQPPALPAVPEWRSGAAVRGEKGAGEARPAPGAGGRRQDRAPPLALTLPRCGPGGNGKAATVTSPSLGDRGTADHPPAPVGVPP